KLFRLTGRDIWLTPNLEAYSHDHHKNRVLQRSLFYLTLDAANHQYEKWKEEHLTPHQMDGDFEGLDQYWTTVYHYKHKLPKNAQWAIIHKQLCIVRGSTPAFQHILVLAKDTEFFYGAVHIKSIHKEQLSVPSLDSVRAAMALDPTASAA
ncbi:hypothetical protein PSTG_16322, partial [Puccinia striiformis f. sp. tritici PST-78]